jgi:hypothetical protein
VLLEEAGENVAGGCAEFSQRNFNKEIL